MDRFARPDFTTIFLVICLIALTASQYTDGSGPITVKKPFHSSPRRIKQSARFSSGQQPLVSSTRLRKPISVSKPSRNLPEPVPELPVFTSGIRGSKPYSTLAPIINLEQNDDASAQPILQSYQIQQPYSHQQEVKPVNEDHEKETDLVQILGYSIPSGHNFLTATASPISTTGPPTLQSNIQYSRPVQVPSTSSPLLQQHRPSPVQYKTARTHHQLDDINEGRQIAKQRTQLTPKKAKQEYYESNRGIKKPVAQVIKRYREETADGSIVWGFENDDGSFKEEVIGIDCITRGKYGYVDPDGIRREYTYETGIKCDEQEQQTQEDLSNTFVDYQENKLVLSNGKTIDLSSMGKKQSRRPQLYRSN